ncbi:sulfite exporter TauE/SafE family protein [Pseudogemmobacter sp. W21_MBD1_M6]|uniref:sulfite exporter TauE/SafE family protein n=1 Tax=Pseudogemmobacter sp. W21_MBD1_M6 TaxID=3240271 RepID=UPI003F9D0BA6
MTLDVTFFLFAVPAVLFAGISKGGFGSGAAFAATPFLALILTPGQAVGLMLPLLMLMDVTALRPYWKKWDWTSARNLMIGSVPGVALGAALYGIANPDVFKLMIGALAVGFVAFQIGRKRGWIRPARQPMGRAAGMLAGMAAGFTSFISHAGGPPAAVYLLSKPLSKTAYQGTTVLVFWAINLMKFIPYFALGIFSKETALANVFLAPVAFAGVYLGVYAHRLLPERIFFGVTYVFLVCTGTKLIVDALS